MDHYCILLLISNTKKLVILLSPDDSKLAVFVTGRTDADVKIRRRFAIAAKTLADRTENPTNYIGGNRMPIYHIIEHAVNKKNYSATLGII